MPAARSRPSAAASRAGASAGSPGLLELALFAQRSRRRSRPSGSRCAASVTSAALSQGFCTKSRTPRRIASTARLIDPQPVMITTGSDASTAWSRATRYDAFATRRRVAGVIRSMRTRSNALARTAARAASGECTGVHRRCPPASAADERSTRSDCHRRPGCEQCRERGHHARRGFQLLCHHRFSV